MIGHYGDGAPIPRHNTNRTVYIDVLESDESTGDKTWSTQIQLSIEKSMAEMWLKPTKSTTRFLLTVGIFGVATMNAVIYCAAHKPNHKELTSSRMNSEIFESKVLPYRIRLGLSIQRCGHKLRPDSVGKACVFMICVKDPTIITKL